MLERETVHQHRRDAEARFLDAWKAAVRAAGPEYFLGPERVMAPTEDEIAAARSRDELRPNTTVIREILPVLSEGEVWFLLTLVGLFNGELAAELAAEIGRPEIFRPDQIAGKDLRRRAIVSELTLTYTGW